MSVILVVDDEEDIRELVGIYLKNEGMQVCKAANGKEALECLEKMDIDLAILDIMMYESDIEVGTKDNVWETALREAFGEHFINMRAFMIEYGLETAGLEPTEQDLDDLANGRVPEQLKDDYTHFNSYGYYAMGAAVYQKGVELGYW